MKKFVFTLRTVFDYKLTVEKTQKAALAAAEALLRELYAEDKKLDETFLRNSLAREVELRDKTADTQSLAAYDAYFLYISEEKKKLKIKIINAEAEKLRCQEALIITMKELKAYNKLRDKQYQEYLKDVAAEEEKELGDIISFSVATGK